MTGPTPAEALKARRARDWRDWTIDKRGCGSCTVREFEAMQVRAIVGLLKLGVLPMGVISR